MIINQDAPVTAFVKTEVRAGAETVWGVLTDINRWPEWNPDVKSASLNGELAQGATFRWKAGPGTIVSTVQYIERPEMIVWSGKTMGIRAVHMWQLDQRAPDRTVVITEESWDGLLPGLLRWPLRRTLQRGLDSGLRHLKAEAERRAAA